ncbi:MAG: hypothetical protein AAF318_12735 [Pseudomonadota bacterium]
MPSSRPAGAVTATGPVVVAKAAPGVRARGDAAVAVAARVPTVGAIGATAAPAQTTVAVPTLRVADAAPSAGLVARPRENDRPREGAVEVASAPAAAVPLGAAPVASGGERPASAGVARPVDAPAAPSALAALPSVAPSARLREVAPEGLIAAALRGETCARLGVPPSADTSEIEITGLVNRDSGAAERAAETVAAVPGVAHVRNHALALNVPCALFEAFALLDAYEGEGVSKAPARALQDVAVFRVNQQLQVQLEKPAFAAYIIADYYHQYGEVFHFDTQHWDRQPFAPGGQLFIGGTGGLGMTAFLIEAGVRELLVVTASSEPLFPEGRPFKSEADDYAILLRQRAKALLDRGGTIEVLTKVIETRN